MSVDQQDLFTTLERPGAWPGCSEAAEVRQTHISRVYLVGDRAWKIKRAVDVGFVDMTSLADRQRFCALEVELNRRLAPEVYRGVVPIVLGPDGEPVVGGSGRPVEYAVEMVRLPDEASLAARVARDEVPEGLGRRIGHRLAAFHAAATRGPEVTRHARWTAVRDLALDNFAETRDMAGDLVAPGVHARLEELTRSKLEELRTLIDARARREVACDGHGDLRLEHLYLLDGEIVIIDCVEFSERFRCSDPVADLAFLVMDLRFHGRPDLAVEVEEAWFEASGDLDGRALMPFYAAYRSTVRAKVRGLTSRLPGLDEKRRQALREGSAGHWLHALATLAPAAERPALILVGGLPGTGKTTLARGLADRAGFELVRSDVVRKKLAGLREDEPAGAGYEQGLYTPERKEQTYRECLRQATAIVRDGGRVLVDAAFWEERRRRELLDAAERLGVPALLFLCEAPPEVVRARLAARRGDASDADWSIYERAREAWEPLSEVTARLAIAIDASRPPEAVEAAALEALAGRALFE